MNYGVRTSGPHLFIKEKEGKETRVPWNTLNRIIVAGRSRFSDGVIYSAIRNSIPVTFIDVMGVTHAHLYPENYSRSDIEDIQSAKAVEPCFCLSTAKSLVKAKIENSLSLLKRYYPQIPGEEEQLADLVKKIETASSLDTLRGFEGTAARIYFSLLPELVTPFSFKKRVYHPPDGEVNAMLSLGYTLLYNRIRTALYDNGFDLYKGFFHKSRGLHAVLASDLMEPLRCVIDDLVIRLTRNKKIVEKDFDKIPAYGSTYYRLNGKGFRMYIKTYEETMQEAEITIKDHSFKCNVAIDEIIYNLKLSLKLSIPFEPGRIV